MSLSRLIEMGQQEEMWSESSYRNAAATAAMYYPYSYGSSMPAYGDYHQPLSVSSSMIDPSFNIGIFFVKVLR